MISMVGDSFSYGELVLVMDESSNYYDKLAVVCGISSYCRDESLRFHPDCYSCDLLTVGDGKKISVRAKFLKKV